MDYLLSLERAIEYIELHLDEELYSEDIAREAGYSLWYLTRIFAAVIGEPMGSYIQKRRLSNACKKLLYSDKRIIDIAVDSGFGSSEAFSRAFKNSYGVSPSVYRKNNLDLYTGSKKMLDRKTLLHLAEGVTIKPRMIEMDEISVAGIRGETSVMHNVLPELWSDLVAMYERIPSQNGARRFGICETDRMKTNRSKDGNVAFTEFVGVEVNGIGCLPEGIYAKTISGGRYAVFTHNGTVATLLKTYDFIWGSWVLFTKEILDAREDFELYDERFLGVDNVASQIDIYIPVK